MSRHITILTSPSGEEFYEAYGPMTKDKSKATVFHTNNDTLRCPQRFGRNGDAHWNCERESEDRALKEYKDWKYRHVALAPLECELLRRAEAGYHPVTIKAMNAALKEIGYTLGRTRDCSGTARYMTGDNAGESYPCITTGVKEIDTGMAYCHFQARRDENFDKLQAIRRNEELFAVVKGRIFEI